MWMVLLLPAGMGCDGMATHNHHLSRYLLWVYIRLTLIVVGEGRLHKIGPWWYRKYLSGTHVRVYIPAQLWAVQPLLSAMYKQELSVFFGTGGWCIHVSSYVSCGCIERYAHTYPRDTA